MEQIKEPKTSKNLVIPLLGAPGTKLSHTTLKQNLINEDIQLESLSKLVERFKPDGIFTFMDLTVEPEALGLEVDFPENKNPSVKVHPIKNYNDLKNIMQKWSGPCGRMEVFIKTMEGMKNNFKILKGGYVIGPFTLASELMGVTETCMNVILDPVLVRQILLFATEVILEYAKELFNAGADVVTVLEPTAVILSPQMYEEFSLAFFKALQKSIDNKRLILHICGNSTHLVSKMVESKVWGLSLDSEVDFKVIKSRIPEDMYLIGNLDPVTIFLQGTPDEVRKATRELIIDMKGMDNFIISSGCDIPLETPLENIEVFMEAAREVIL